MNLTQEQLDNMSVVEYAFADLDGKYYIRVSVDKEPYYLGPYFSEIERKQALGEVLKITSSMGAIEIPVKMN